MFLEHPSTNSVRKFFNSWKVITDYGACCVVSPYINFINEETKGIDPDNYEGKHYQYISKGAHSGQFGGITFLLDVETFEYSYTDKVTVGLKIAFSDQRDMAMITQNGYNISPGKKKNQHFLLHKSLTFSYSSHGSSHMLCILELWRTCPFYHLLMQFVM